MMDIKTISFEQAVRMHSYIIERYGGADGIRDEGALKSSLAAPLATFGSEYLHESLLEMAAAHLFYLIKNHPFLDGNKRTATQVAMAFMRLNSISYRLTEDQWVDLAVAVAKGELDKDGIAKLFGKKGR